MAQAVVTIAGRTYRMNCDEGEEAHIESLAKLVDEKIESLRGSFGEIGDQRIVVMAALTIADEFAAAQRQLAAQGEALAQAREQALSADQRRQEWAEEAATALNDAAGQVEAATRALNGELS